MIISVTDIFCGEATQSAGSTNPSPSRYNVIDMVPKARCLGLSQRHSAFKVGPMTTLTTWGRHGRIPRHQVGVGHIRRRTRDMRKSGAEAGAPAIHRLPLWTPFLPRPGGEGKSRLGGELQREEQRHLGRGSAWTGKGHLTTCARGFLACLPPHLRHDRSRTEAEVM
jgi:hypothetical protein